MRRKSKVPDGWCDYKTPDAEILNPAARVTATDLLYLSRPGFMVRFYDTLE